MNNIQEDDWADDSWSRHSGMLSDDEYGSDSYREVDVKLCPLCGKPNYCKAESSERCWCFDTSVPQQLLEQVPQELQGKSCICQACIEAYNKHQAVSHE